MKTISANLFVYGAAHLLVDAVCIGVLFSVVSSPIYSSTFATYLIITYNLLAFGLQVFVGFLADILKASRVPAALGIAITALSTVFIVPVPAAAVVIAGIGNALFHVGGGVVSLGLTPRRAAAPGIFVAPGALGLMVGTLLGKSGHFVAWPFLIGLTFMVVLIFVVPRTSSYGERAHPSPRLGPGAEYVIYLVLFVIAVRSLAGFALVFPWKSDVGLLVLLTMSVVLGKGLGGLLADRFGWTITAVGSLVASIPLLSLGGSVPALGMLGVFLFNITMPVTLTMVSNMLPGRPGTSFGLTCAALVLGTLPAFSQLRASLGATALIDTVIAVSAVALFISLQYYRRWPPITAGNRSLRTMGGSQR